MAQLVIEHVIVPLDGSPFAERALPVASALAEATGAVVDVLAVAADDAEEQHLRDYLDGLGASLTTAPASLGVSRGDDPADTIAAVELEHEPAVVCMATHGRGRSAAFLGSVARRVLSVSGEPIVLVGPLAGGSASDEASAGAGAGEAPARGGHGGLPEGLAGGPVVACVDGSTDGEGLIPTAASWARALGRTLTIATVAEPVPEPMRAGEPYRRRHGPQVDADRYIDDLVLQARGDNPGVEVDGKAIYDPISAEEGLRGWLSTAPVGLVAVASRSRRRLAQAVVGSTAAAIVRHSRVPVLAIRRI
jgi:nucleotide-binding universal stress UspA family protein